MINLSIYLYNYVTSRHLSRPDNMPISYLLDPTIFLFASTISAAVLPPLQLLTGQLDPTLYVNNGSEISLASNLTTTSPIDPSTGLNAVQVSCNGRQFGSGLDIGACAQALRSIIVAHPGVKSFGMRLDGTVYDVDLPYWWIDCE